MAQLQIISMWNVSRTATLQTGPTGVPRKWYPLFLFALTTLPSEYQGVSTTQLNLQKMRQCVNIFPRSQSDKCVPGNCWYCLAKHWSFYDQSDYHGNLSWIVNKGLQKINLEFLKLIWLPRVQKISKWAGNARVCLGKGRCSGKIEFPCRPKLLKRHGKVARRIERGATIDVWFQDAEAGRAMFA